MTEVFVAQVTSYREKAAKIYYTDVYFHFRSQVLVSASRANASAHHFALTVINLSLRHPIMDRYKHCQRLGQRLFSVINGNIDHCRLSSIFHKMADHFEAFDIVAPEAR